MEPDRWQRIQVLFDGAVALDPSERRDFLERECAGATGLVDEVLELLDHDRPAGHSIGRIVRRASADHERGEARGGPQDPDGKPRG